MRPQADGILLADTLASNSDNNNNNNADVGRKTMPLGLTLASGRDGKQ